MNLDVTDLVLLDAHVHFHPSFDPTTFLEAAYANFRDNARRFHADRPFIGVLLLTESPQENSFDRLLMYGKQQCTTGNAGSNGWSLRPTEEDISMVFSSGDEKAVVVIAGRQVISRENLEVLAVGTRQPFEAGASVQDLIHHVARVGALPILPWGFGKWMGARGKLVRQLLQNPELPPFFLGDSANRAAFSPPSPLFRLAEKEGIRNLPGSDPLPLSKECRRPGSFGSILEGTLNLATPARDLKAKLSDPHTPIHYFGHGEGPFRFVRNQLAMQVRKLTHP